jgi:hypothetical protein
MQTGAVNLPKSSLIADHNLPLGGSPRSQRVEITPADFSGPGQPISIPADPGPDAETNHRQISDDDTTRHLFPHDQQVSGVSEIDNIAIAGAQGLGNGITSSCSSWQSEIMIRGERRPNQYHIYPCSGRIEEFWIGY